MATTVLVTEAFLSWLAAQTAQVQDQIDVVIRMLEMRGVLLGAPFSSQIQGSDKLRELRPAGGASPARVFYAFDQDRAAVVLCGGVKTDAKLYERAIATAEREFARHRAAVEAARTRSSGQASPRKRR